MWTMQRTRGGKETDYGLGWGIRMTEGRVTGVSHTGNQAGASGGLRLAVADGGAIAIMTNLEDVDIAALFKELVEVLRPASATNSSSGRIQNSESRIWILTSLHPMTVIAAESELRSVRPV
jgi:hypothetical protein